MIITLREVAKASGVHPSTASRALNDRTRGLVNDEVAARIISEAERLGYRPDTAAAALRSGRSRLVGALVPGIANPVFTPILAGAVAALAREHFALIVADPGRDGGSAFDMVQELAARRVEGLLLATTLGLPDPCIELARARNIPYVLINRGLPGLASVVPDNAMGMGLVLNHLRSLGHCHIGYVSGFAHLVADTVRSECFVDLMRAAGLDADLVEEAHSFDRAGGLAATRALLARAPEMTALVCGNDLIAAGAYDAARERGISVPDRLSITGFNDLPLMDLMAPPLTTVRVDFHRMGERAAEILLGQLDVRGDARSHSRSSSLGNSMGNTQSGPFGPHRMEAMLAELVVRGSTAPAPAGMVFPPGLAMGLARPSVAS